MGTDIHFYVERRKNGKWESCDTWEDAEYPEDGEKSYKTVPFGKHYYDGRNYDLFAILADVRNGRGFAGIKTGDGFVPISEPRGLPEDMSDELTAEAERFLKHTPSWLLLSEIMEFDWTQVTKKSGIVSAYEFCQWRAWDRGQGYGPKKYSGGIFGAKIEMISAEEMEKRVGKLDEQIRAERRGDSNGDIWKAIGDRLQNVYCEVCWEAPYYRQAKNFLSECVPKLWRLGKTNDVRCVFWFDS